MRKKTSGPLDQDSAEALEAAELLDRALRHLYDGQRGRNPDSPENEIWKELWQRLKERLDRDGKRSREAPDRITVYDQSTFKRLRLRLAAGKGLTKNDRRVMMAVVGLMREGRPPYGLLARMEAAAEELGRVRAPAGDGGTGREPGLREASERARRDAGRLDGRSAITLDQVYVPRGREERLARVLKGQLDDGRAERPVQLVLGEAGTGKTSMLWYVAGLLEGRRAAADPAGSAQGAVIRPLLLRAEELLDQGADRDVLDWLDRGSRQKRIKAGRVVLLDTVDLLLGDETGRQRLRRTVEVCGEHGIPLAMGCRIRDQDLLKSLLGATSYEVGAETGDFRFGGEAERAIEVYCRHYLAEESPDARAEAAGTLVRAAVRGLAVREVVARPLTLRMLFEVYAPSVPTKEIDAGGLYDLYWDRRVRTDGRSGAARGVRTADLTRPAQGLARLMLHDGVAALPVARAVERLPDATPRPDSGDPLEQLAALEHRGVVTGAADSGDGSARFFHQTLYEYAAGRCIRDLADEGASYYAALGDHLQAHPEDFLRAVVAEQALIQGIRHGAGSCDDATDLLVRLLESGDVRLQMIAVRAYALLPQVFAEVVNAVHAFLPAAKDVLVRELLGLLPTRQHADATRVTRDVAVVLRHHGDMQRRVLDLLCRFGQVDKNAAQAVLGLLRELCADGNRCVSRREPVDDPGTAVCGGPHCLWSWLLGLKADDMGSHGDHAVRLLDALARHRADWAVHRMRDLLLLAERSGSRRQLWRCVPPVHRRVENPDWYELLGLAARIAARLGPEPSSRSRLAKNGKNPEQREQDRRAQDILDAHWHSSARDRPPREVVDELAGTGFPPFKVPAQQLRAMLAHVGERLRRDGQGVPELLDHVLALCGASGKGGEIGRYLLTPLLAEPADDPGTRAAAEWCAALLRRLSRARLGEEEPRRAALFAASGICGLPPARQREIVEAGWSQRGNSWDPWKTEMVFLSHGATVIAVPLAAAGQSRAAHALRHWRGLERERTTQISSPSPVWPGFLGEGVWHDTTRDQVNKVLHAGFIRHAPAHHGLVADAIARKAALADIPWLARLARSTAEDRTSTSHDTARALLFRYGEELRQWCEELWQGGSGSCPDTRTRSSALCLWGDLVRIGAAERPSFVRQAELFTGLKTGDWGAAVQAMEYWNSYDVCALAGAAGQRGWAEVDEILARAPGRAGGGVLRRAAALRTFLRCRFAPLTTAREVDDALDAVRIEVLKATRTLDIHDCGAGFLAERLCDRDPAQAVDVVLLVARRATGFTRGKADADPHHVTRLAWLWQKPLTRIAVTADREQWLRLVSGLARGPLTMLQKSFEVAVIHRRDEDVHADARRLPEDGPYREKIMTGLHGLAVRHRTTPPAERTWSAVLEPV